MNQYPDSPSIPTGVRELSPGELTAVEGGMGLSALGAWLGAIARQITFPPLNLLD